MGSALASPNVLVAFVARAGVLMSDVSAVACSGSARTAALLLLASSASAPTARAVSACPGCVVLPREVMIEVRGGRGPPPTVWRRLGPPRRAVPPAPARMADMGHAPPH